MTSKWGFHRQGSSQSLTLDNHQVKLEAQYNAKREAQLNEVADIKQQLELRNTEIRNLNASIDSLKSVNEELKVCFFPMSA